MEWWRQLPFAINPNILSIGSFYIRYYGLMYIFAFASFFFLTLYRLKTEKKKCSLTREQLESFMMYVIAGIMAGGRLGYVLFYDLKYYLANPAKIILPFYFSEGKLIYTGLSGMSYHGGLIGTVIVTILFCRIKKINFTDFTDFIIPAIPLAYTFGRIGNFINGELYGRITSFGLGMYFPLDPEKKLRHPSQLYEAFFEGILLFLILWLLRKKLSLRHSFLGLYIFFYGFFRFFIEFVREPDSQLGFILGPFTMGQILCFIMMLAGISLIAYNKLKLGNAAANKTA